MTMIALLALAWLLLLVWVIAVWSPGCGHENVRGVANYYDRDLHCFIHLKECEDCHMIVITHER